MIHLQEYHYTLQRVTQCVDPQLKDINYRTSLLGNAKHLDPAKQQKAHYRDLGLSSFEEFDILKTFIKHYMATTAQVTEIVMSICLLKCFPVTQYEMKTCEEEANHMQLMAKEIAVAIGKAAGILREQNPELFIRYKSAACKLKTLKGRLRKVVVAIVRRMLRTQLALLKLYP